MSQKIAAGMAELHGVVTGATPAARVHINGHAYVPEDRWQPIETAPKDGTEFQAWVDKYGWEPKARINPETEAVELWGRVDYDQEGWDVYLHMTVTHWMPMPLPPAPNGE